MRARSRLIALAGLALLSFTLSTAHASDPSVLRVTRTWTYRGKLAAGRSQLHRPPCGAGMQMLRVHVTATMGAGPAYGGRPGVLQDYNINVGDARGTRATATRVGSDTVTVAVQGESAWVSVWNAGGAGFYRCTVTRHDPMLSPGFRPR